MKALRSCSIYSRYLYYSGASSSCGCRQLVAFAEAQAFDAATINACSRLDREVRNSDRVIMDDVALASPCGSVTPRRSAGQPGPKPACPQTDNHEHHRDGVGIRMSRSYVVCFSRQHNGQTVWGIAVRVLLCLRPIPRRSVRGAGPSGRMSTVSRS